MTRSAKEKTKLNTSVNTGVFTEVESATHKQHISIMMRIRKHCIKIQQEYIDSPEHEKDFNKRQLPGLKRMCAKLPESMRSEFTDALQSYKTLLTTDFAFPNNEPTNEQIGTSNYKFHVSLSPQSYDLHKQVIIQLLEEALQQDIIGHFKYVDQHLLIGEIERDNDKSPRAKGEEYNKLAKHKLSCERLLNGDQFTIYIPLPYDKEKMFELCSKINETLKTLNATPGQFAVSESQLTSYISLRQDTFQGQYIEATDATIRPIQETSPIFTYLQFRFEPDSQLADARLHVIKLRDQITHTDDPLDSAIIRLSDNLTTGLSYLKDKCSNEVIVEHFINKQSEIENDLKTIQQSYTNKVMLYNAALAVLSVLALCTGVYTMSTYRNLKKNMEEVGNPFVFSKAIKASLLALKAIESDSFKDEQQQNYYKGPK